MNVIKHKLRLGPDNIMDILPDYDIVVDGLDNFPTRYLLNDASVRLRIPVVSAAILGFDGQLSVFKPYAGPCYRCLFPVPPPAELAPSCGANGVIGVLPGTMGLLQATEVIKLILDVGNPLIGRLMMYDALAATVTEVKVRRDPECPVCSRDPDEITDSEMGVFPGLRGVLRRRTLTQPLGNKRDMATIRIPPVLRSAVGGERELKADGDNVGAILQSIVESHPSTADQLFSADGELNRYVNVYLNDEDVRVLDGLETAVGGSDTIVILPAMAGGQRLRSGSGLRWPEAVSHYPS